MQAGGFIKQSLIDYPGKIAAVIFTRGCNLRCPYCHNPGLVLPERIRLNPHSGKDDIFSYIEKNKDLLDAVVVTGGEPLFHADSIDFIRRIKTFGLAVKVDTNGTYPQKLKSLIQERLADFIAMDVKAPPVKEKYQKITGIEMTEKQFSDIGDSIEVIMNSGVDYEFRTTIFKDWFTAADIYNIGEKIRGAARYALQTFQPVELIDPQLRNCSPYSSSELKEIAVELKKNHHIKEIILR